MIKHNLLLIYRNFRRFKSTFLINLIGLSAGLACALIIYLWVNDELSVDGFHNNGGRLYRVMVNKLQNDNIDTSPSTQAILAEAIQEKVPEVEYAVATIGGAVDFTLSVNERHIKGATLLADKDFFELFSFPLIQGNKREVLSDKKGIVLSESKALALFNTVDGIVGKTIEWQFPYGKDVAYVSGVFRDIPPHSSMKFDALMSFEVYKDIVGKESLHWGNFGCNTFVLLKGETDVENVNAKIVDLIKRKSKDATQTLFIRPYSEYYLHGKYSNGQLVGGRIEYVRLFSIIGIFILLIACINFMNLSTAKATRRIKEVGIKKAIGASRRNLIFHYLGESMLMTFLSLSIAVLCADLLLPQFNLITGKQLQFTATPRLVGASLVIALFSGLVAGSYPALYLSKFSPSIVLRGKFAVQTGSLLELFLRRSLIVFQFSLSVVFIVSVLVIYKQIQFVQTTNLGYDKEHIIYFKPEGKAAEHLETFLTEVKKLDGVAQASSIARTIVGTQSSTVGYFNWEGKDPDAVIPFEIVNSNYDVIETLGIKMSEGRSFSREFASDTSAIIFNKAAIRVMGFGDPIGKIFNLWGKDLKIIGVTEDFHFESLHEQVKPLFFRLAPAEAERIMIRILPGREKETIATVSHFYNNFNPGFAFDYKFLDQEYQTQYEAERRVSTLSKYFAALAILISCLGLFGLAAFTAERRMKEIGIRKVLGSSSLGILYLLSGEFTKTVFISIVIALPLSYFITKRWLEGFAFRIELHWWYFIGAGVLALVIAWLTVSIQAIKAARVSPAKCLKDE